ncbi:patatin-like phospholipase family protein [Texcoconibacillus texcoconensis]|uniref:NTE family protein n=1 Tax=Texcoconibacillus texcoconensis TaxID=1095777 RepID=A0A840QLE7_9BACI|nr:patatin-like phospholipase family protein [Texcoconibacillus texcoconensis]MBB5172194.1 NTE family protein [Texcoconibacillus texcoconensis]
MSGYPKIGLALGSGGSRGFAHIGVLKVLEEEGIPVDFIAGSSMGALVGSLYGAGYSPSILEKMAFQFRRKYFMDFTVPKMGLIKGEKARTFTKMLVRGKNIEDLPRKMAIVATNLRNGKRTVFREGDIAEAVRASIAIPGIFVPHQIDGELYVDGGVIDRVPVSVVRDMGAAYTIGVDVSYFDTDPEILSIYDVIMQSMDIMERELVSDRHIAADCMIQPLVSHFKSTSFQHVHEIIRQGEQAMRDQLPLVKNQLETWKEKQDGNEQA